MSHPNPNEEFAGQVKNCSFTTTNWKAVLASQGNDSLEAQQALEELCRTYWYPLYVFLRRNGHSPEEAEDLTQGLFAHLIKTGALAQVDREKGRFRDFLLACLKNQARTAYEKATAQKRGGKSKDLSLDAQMAEQRYSMEPAHELTPEKIFEQRWASTLLATVHSRLKRQFEANGDMEWFEALKPYLTAKTTEKTYVEVAKDLRATESTVKSRVQSIRRQYRDLIREEVQKTVLNPADVEEEIRHLIALVGS